ncbi:uncharacterized protein LOC141908126 [Tubulanus polymorphus]|uniref:uncharacterized protein LOC141908126 n=1 Tax=Tubulanus polymorphus TaxID=672921 RepID=UPI003DA46CDC
MKKCMSCGKDMLNDHPYAKCANEHILCPQCARMGGVKSPNEETYRKGKRRSVNSIIASRCKICQETRLLGPPQHQLDDTSADEYSPYESGAEAEQINEPEPPSPEPEFFDYALVQKHLESDAPLCQVKQGPVNQGGSHFGSQLCHRDAEYWCSDCKINICQNCVETHVPRGRDAVNHRIYPISESEKYKMPSCSYHADENVKYFCNDDGCKVPICDLCVGYHKDHDMMDVYGGMREMNQYIDDTLSQAKMALAKDKDIEASNDVVRGKKMLHVDNLRRCVNLRATTLISIIERSRLALMDKINALERDFATKGGIIAHSTKWEENKLRHMLELHKKLLEKGSTPARTIDLYTFIRNNELKGFGHAKPFRTPRDDDGTRCMRYVFRERKLDDSWTDQTYNVLGELKVADSDRPSIVATISTKSRNDRQTPSLLGCAVLPDNRIVVPDFRNKNIKIIEKRVPIDNKEAEFWLVDEFNGDFENRLEGPCDVAVLPNGNILVADSKKNCIIEFSVNGEMIRKLELDTPKCLVVYGDEIMVVCGDDKVFIPCIKASSFKVVARYQLENCWPHFIAVMRSGEIVVSDIVQNEVYFLTKNFEKRRVYVQKSQAMKLEFPCGITIDHTGHILIADWSNSRIHELSTEGEFIRVLLKPKDGIRHPRAITIDNEGNLVVCESGGVMKTFTYT